MTNVNRRRTRGTSLLEILIAMAMFSIVTAVATYEFEYVIQERSFIDAHLSSQQQAQIAMARVTAAVRQASTDVTDFTPPAKPPAPVIQPVATATPLIQFYQAASLAESDLPVVAGEPKPCFDSVSIHFFTPAPTTPPITTGYIAEDIIPVAGACAGAPPPNGPIILAQNVSRFMVTPLFLGGSTADGYQIDITITAPESDQRQSPEPASLSFTVNPLKFGEGN